MSELSTINPLSIADGLDAYITRVHQIPLLSAEKEQELASRLSECGDVEAARELVLSHLRLVVKVARGYLGYGLSFADLIQEGNIGLMKAVKRFDPKVGVRLVTFAIHWIKAEIHEFILKNWRMVKIATTKAQRKLFFNLRKFKSTLGWLSKDEVAMVAEELDVPEHEVQEMEKRLHHHDLSFEGGQDEDASTPYLGFLLTDGRKVADDIAEEEARSQQHQLLSSALLNLDDRSRRIIESRYLSEKKSTLKELAAELNMSAERVRQLEVNVLKKMKKVILEGG